jgi:hypothetical protein
MVIRLHSLEGESRSIGICSSQKKEIARSNLIDMIDEKAEVLV